MTHPTSKTANLCPIGTASTFSWWVKIFYLLISQIEQPVTFVGDYVHSWLRWHCLRNCPWPGLPSKKMLWQPIYIIVSSNCWCFYGWHIKILREGLVDPFSPSPSFMSRCHFGCDNIDSFFQVLFLLVGLVSTYFFKAFYKKHSSEACL